MAHQLNLNTTALEELKAKAQALPAEKKVQASKSVTPGTTEQTVTPDSGYDGLESVSVEAMPQGRMGPIDITVSSFGLITAQPYVDSPGYITQAEMDSNTKQLTVQGAQTITPGTANKTIASGRYLTGTQTIKGDANLVAGNIKSGVSIFGVAGSYEGSGGGSSGGGSVEACTVEILAAGPTVPIIFYFIDADGAVQSVNCSPTDMMMGVQLVVHGNSSLVGDTIICSIQEPEGGAIRMGPYCYYITGDATVYIGG